MTFETWIKMLNILDHDGEILVMEEIAEGEIMREVCTISKYSDISDSMKYFTESKYSLYIYEKNKPYYELEELSVFL